MEVIAAQTVEATLAGMAGIGVDVAAIRAEAKLPSGPHALGELWPRSVMAVAWGQAFRQFPRPTTPAEVGMAVPFGAFGIVDYLIASGDTMGGGLHALVAHYGPGTTNPELRLVEAADAVRLEVRARPSAANWLGEEFSLALTLKNLRYIAAEPVPVVAVELTRPDPDPGALAAVFDAPVRFERPVSALCFAPSVMSLPLRTADPLLHRTMEGIVGALELGRTRDPFEQAIRARLREMLPRGDGSADAMARSLGVSERTLHRRLKDRGATWRATVDAFRDEESKRLLREGRLSLAAIALGVGFSEQSAWTRAFRRWTGRSPAQWAREQGRRSPG